MSFVYRSGGTLDTYTVGHYVELIEGGSGWHIESTHATREAAADRVHYLNGGMDRKALRESVVCIMAAIVFALPTVTSNEAPVVASALAGMVEDLERSVPSGETNG